MRVTIAVPTVMTMHKRRSAVAPFLSNRASHRYKGTMAMVSNKIKLSIWTEDALQQASRYWQVVLQSHLHNHAVSIIEPSILRGETTICSCAPRLLHCLSRLTEIQKDPQGSRRIAGAMFVDKPCNP
jgi:hypothetical protein